MAHCPQHLDKLSRLTSCSSSKQFILSASPFELSPFGRTCKVTHHHQPCLTLTKKCPTLETRTRKHKSFPQTACSNQRHLLLLPRTRYTRASWLLDHLYSSQLKLRPLFFLPLSRSSIPHLKCARLFTLWRLNRSTIIFAKRHPLI